jgi:integrase
MVFKLPPGIHRQVRDSGKVRYYWHPGRGTGGAGPRKRLPDDPHSPEFWAALAAARTATSSTSSAQTPTVAAMVDAYFASPLFAEKKPSTQREYLRYLREFQEELGGIDPDDLKPFHLARVRDNLAATPAKANSTLKSIGALYSWGRERGWVTQANPATGLGKLQVGEHAPWPQEALDAFPVALPPDLARCCMVGLYTGQRLGDVLAMRRSAVEGNGLWVRQEKTGKLLLIPIHSAIHDLVTAASDVLCPKATGEAFTTDQFHAALGRARAKLPEGSPLKTPVFHGLRKNATGNLLEAGCSEAEVASVTGMSLAMVVHYGKGARQQRLAREAMRKLELYPGTAKTEPSH